MTNPSALLFGSLNTLLEPDEVWRHDPDTFRRPKLRVSALRLIAEAKAMDIRLGLVSDLPAPALKRSLRELEPFLSEMDFAVITSASVIARPKPHPSAYHIALDQLDLPARACIAVEENHTAALSSLQAGIRTMVVPDQTAPSFRNQDFDAIVRVQIAQKASAYA